LLVFTASLAAVSLTGCAKKKEVVIEELEVAESSKDFKVFKVYTDQRSPDNHYIPSGWMGDWGDIKLNDRWMEGSHSGTTCIRIEYAPKRSQGAGWVGIYWQNPANNWGSKKAGFDLTGAKKLTFWVRGEKGNEVISEFKMGGLTGEFSDSDAAGIGPVMLTKDWKEYEIDLAGKDLSHIIGGFCFSANSDDNPDGFIIYLDDLKYQ
jgi:hypothetical protein